MVKYQVDKSYISLMLACKHSKNNNIRHCIAKIIGIDENEISDSDANYWLSKTVEAFRPYAKSIQNRGLYDMCEYISRYEYLYKAEFQNEYQRVNQWLIHLLRDLQVREKDEHGNYYNLYDLGGN